MREEADSLVVSIFVNPLQFNDPDDFKKYPSTFESDAALLKEEGVDIIFAPSTDEIYPSGCETRVRVSELSKPLEGVFRPGHFEGVATVVTILFNIISPDAAIFGEKDFQQLRMIERLTADLRFPVRIMRGPIVREPDGLALSSRNARLSGEGRKNALVLSRALARAAELVKAGEMSASAVKSSCEKLLSPPVKPEYFQLVDEEKLEPADILSPGGLYRALTACYVEDVRLIDNMPIRP